jgi:hypothetical protein
MTFTDLPLRMRTILLLAETVMELRKRCPERSLAKPSE